MLLLGSACCCWVLSAAALCGRACCCRWVLPAAAGFCLVLLGSACSCWVLLDVAAVGKRAAAKVGEVFVVFVVAFLVPDAVPIRFRSGSHPVPATALRHRLDILARHLEMGEGEAVDHAWVQRFVAAHTRLVELGCRLEEGFVDVDSEVERLQRVLAHPRVLKALKDKPEEPPLEQNPSGQVFHYGDEEEAHSEDLENTYEAFEHITEDQAE
eukprot:s1430_g16.t1